MGSRLFSKDLMTSTDTVLMCMFGPSFLKNLFYPQITELHLILSAAIVAIYTSYPNYLTFISPLILATVRKSIGSSHFYPIFLCIRVVFFSQDFSITVHTRSNALEIFEAFSLISADPVLQRNLFTYVM